jgi:hypothetical protein
MRRQISNYFFNSLLAGLPSSKPSQENSAQAALSREP